MAVGRYWAIFLILVPSAALELWVRRAVILCRDEYLVTCLPLLVHAHVYIHGARDSKQGVKRVLQLCSHREVTEAT